MPLSSSTDTIRVAVLGLGNVGRAFTGRVAAGFESAGRPVEIVAVADRSGGLRIDSAEALARALECKERAGSLRDCAGSAAIATVPEFLKQLPECGVRVLVEALPTNVVDGQPALSWLLSALGMGISVVTVDKGPLVHGFDALRTAGDGHGASIRFSGTTGIRPPSELRDRRIVEIEGVLNGTTNFVLTEMQEQGRPFQEAVGRARELGIAEPDPALDLSGWDSACKIWILARAWMGARCPLDGVSRVEIGEQTEILVRTARESGRVVRLVCRAEARQGGARLSVAPEMLDGDSPLYAVSGTEKAAVFRTDRGEELPAAGISGRDAIARTILDDIQRIVSA